ncbi:acetoin dehydrogenase dihydrolipoyllysine-residue acetyltransferase subunit [Enterovibrio sp. ZSDZ35]|uniref:Acetoin dehydrogenase dihydrolipoyllysine-residue acetyltransferase subunit n=1 Tax=Enterovibrio qingdaonensis TaxID=2899818 RepID=A0ABT5QSA2_9GAMM|nr:acetoin dehydrogenase dihydrolipoyllysine-residue acetyltransferase subunit [Enterovibrio sp. ZSDZ35]MDD1783862.1 acetoin dehydrogenase dihydrolipoyllysine-residue acetyltransferase subunit [Enterovibrio sp. ZSDZ35]
MSEKIIPVVMPKWGLSMKEGTLTEWHVDEGDTIEVGQVIMDVETDKIASEVEAPDAGLLRRKVAQEGDVYSVQALLGVLAPPEVTDEEIDAYVAAFVQPSSEEGDEEEAASAYAFIDTDAGRIRYSHMNAEAPGTPYVLIHGFGGDLDNWLFNLDALAENAPVLALDLPCHGQSEISENIRFTDLINTVVTVMDKLDIGKAHLVGHSMGGLISGELAKLHPDKVASLTLIGSAGLGQDINSDYIRGFVDSESRKNLKPVLQLLFADSSLVTRNLVDDVLKYKRLDGVKTSLNALANQLFVDGTQHIALDLDSSPSPLVIWGEVDAVIPASHATNIRNAEIHVLAEAGHMVQMEQANNVNTLILAHTR